MKKFYQTRAEAERIQYNCMNCGKKIEHVEKLGPQAKRFCSQRCHEAYLSGKK